MQIRSARFFCQRRHAVALLDPSSAKRGGELRHPSIECAIGPALPGGQILHGQVPGLKMRVERQVIRSLDHMQGWSERTLANFPLAI